MDLKKKFKRFNDSILELHPDLREVLVPNDQYPELKNIKKNRLANLPVGSFNTKVIISDGKVVERVFKTPMGQVVSLFSNSFVSNLDQVA